MPKNQEFIREMNELQQTMAEISIEIQKLQLEYEQKKLQLDYYRKLLENNYFEAQNN